MENLVDNYSGFNFHTWRMKMKMQLMNKILWGIVRKTPIDANKLFEWNTRDDKAKAKAIIGLAIADFEQIVWGMLAYCYYIS